ncbi:MAG: DoxX family protein [Bacteroidota bacterium]|nr:DoxX family protein [Bacteroidota bacterium]
MKKIKITYWIVTGLFAAFMIFSAIPDMMSTPEAVAIVTTHLGYPVYFIPFIGVAKLLGAVAILIPGFPRIKEWAYAGLAFDLIGAAYSSIKVGDPVSGWSFMFLPLIFLAASYIFYHKKLAAAI